MMRNVAAGVLEVVAGWIDDSISAPALQHFLKQQLSLKRRRDGTFGSPLLRKAADYAAQAGVVEQHARAESISLRSALPSRDMCAQWVLTPEQDRIVRWKGVWPDTGEYMLALYMDGDLEQHSEWLEMILRHVEVRRREALCQLPDGSPSGQNLTRSQVAYLFSRIAVDRKDMRFLNAGMKLNDWSFHRRQRLTALEGEWLLVAVAGVEVALKGYRE